MAHFTALRAFASKEYKFHQRKSIARAEQEYGAAAANGVCFGVVMMWMKEKLTTTGSLPGGLQNLKFAPRLNANIHVRTETTMLQAAAFQSHYSRHGVDNLAQHMNLHEAAYTVDTASRRNESNMPEVEILATLVRAGENLPEGHAIAMELKVRDAGSGTQIGGHAIGMYRSRGRTLHFFDPNVGVYEVRNIPDFMQAWLDGCRYGRGWVFSPFRDHSQWIYCYER
jgi:hypothetical protein